MQQYFFAISLILTNLSATITPEELVRNLNGIFTLFDGITSSYHLEKIKTIGDAYMIVGGVPL